MRYHGSNEYSSIKAKWGLGMNKKMLAMIMVGALLIVAATSAWLLASGRVAFVIKAPSDRVVVTPRVCDDAVIAKYNEVIESKDFTQYTERLKASDAAVAQLNGADRDPNCMYIRYSYSVRSGQYDKAQQYLDTLKGLADRHIYATAELSDTQSISAMEARLKAAKNAGSSGEKLPAPSDVPSSGDGRG